MKRILIIGLGIGEMYKRILEKDYKVITIDINPNKYPNYLSLVDCLLKEESFDLGIICTPNYLHEYYARELITHNFAENIFVEKPGFESVKKWKEIYALKNNIFMIKNNMYRTGIFIEDFIDCKSIIDCGIEKILITWSNKDRIPSPGSWFTTKGKAFGGVSRDLLPHLLHLHCLLFYDTPKIINKIAHRRFNLENISSTDYGTINKEGKYDVDDICMLESKSPLLPFPIFLICDWKNNIKDKIDIEIVFNADKPRTIIELGLCPESCYKEMFDEILQLEDLEDSEDVKNWKKYYNFIDNKVHEIIDSI